MFFQWHSYSYVSKARLFFVLISIFNLTLISSSSVWKQLKCLAAVLNKAHLKVQLSRGADTQDCQKMSLVDKAANKIFPFIWEPSQCAGQLQNPNQHKVDLPAFSGSFDQMVLRRKLLEDTAIAD